MIALSTWKKTVIMDQKGKTLDFGGCLTPSEMAAIAAMENVVARGVGMFNHQLENMKKGISNPTWIYFLSSNSEVNALVREHCYRDHTK